RDRFDHRRRRIGYRQARRRIAIGRIEPEAVSTLYERDKASIAGIEKLRFFPLEVVSGHGSTLVTPDGRELLDLSATWTAFGLGHGHPAVAEAVSRAVRTAPGSGGLSALPPAFLRPAAELFAPR